MQTERNFSMNCDIETGICEIPQRSGNQTRLTKKRR
jgi:hypothetical protein